MKHDWSISPLGIVVLVSLLLSAGFFVSAERQTPADSVVSRIPIYFEDGPLIVDQMRVDEARHVELISLVRHLALPYTDATRRETLTIRASNGTLVATRDSDVVSIDDRQTRLADPVLRVDGRWFVPIDFLLRPLSDVAGVEFRHRQGAERILAGNVMAPTLVMKAGPSEGSTRLTIESSTGINMRVQQEPGESRVVLFIDRAPVEPADEALAYRDPSIREIAFEDSDGRSKIIIETTSQVANVRLLPSDENRRFFVDFIRASETGAVSLPSGMDRRGAVSAGALRVIVIDPGHGGLDSGTRAHGILEKDITLELARRLRRALQLRLDTTVILTRDGDVERVGENRSAIANNNRADLFISLHVGFSADPTESSSSLFLVETRSETLREAPVTNLFQPWYAAHRHSAAGSVQFATTLQESLVDAIPGWPFPIRRAPISVLTSSSMPGLMLELGNANNEANLRALTDAGFQGRLIEAIVEAAARFGGMDMEGS